MFNRKSLLTVIFLVVIVFGSLLFLYWQKNNSPSADVVDICPLSACSESNVSDDCLDKCYKIGCENSTDTKCLDFGSGDQSDSLLQISDPTRYSVIQNDGDIHYRSVLSDSTGSKFSFPAFNTDSDGYPLSPMMLEIRFKDNYNDGRSATSSRSANRIKISSVTGDSIKIDPIVGLGGTADNSWKIIHVVVGSSEFSRMKSVNGNFTFIIDKTSGAYVDLPIDYISIRAITSQLASKLIRSSAIIEGFREVNYQQASNKTSGTVWFSRSLSEPIYQNTIPETSEINQTISKQYALGEPISIPISLRSDADINNITFSSDGSNIKIQQVAEVVQNYRRWVHSINKTFGLVPDYIKKISSSALTADTTKTYIIDIEPMTSAGEYQSKIIVSDKSGKLLDIPIDIVVNNFVLENSSYKSFLYNQFTENSYSKNSQIVLPAVKKNLINPLIVSADSSSISITTDATGKIINYNTDKFESELSRFSSAGVLSQESYVIETVSYQIQEAIKKTDNEYSALNYSSRLTDPKFISAYRLLYDKLNLLAEKYNTKFVYSVVDEPQNIIYRRVVADRLYKLLNDFGCEIWVTYYPESKYDSELVGDSTPNSLLYIDQGEIIPKVESIANLEKICAIFQVADDNYKKCNGYYTSAISQNSNPVYNRFLLGYYSLKFNPTTVAVYAYGDSLGDPYNDFDKNWSVVSSISEPDYNLAYPSNDGLVYNTLKYYGVRDGYIDAMYIEKLKKLIESKKDNPISQEAQSYLDSLSDRISINFRDNYKNSYDDFGFYKPILSDISSIGLDSDYSSFDTIRREISALILKLGTTDSSNSNLIVTSSSKYAYASGEVKFNIEYTNANDFLIENAVVSTYVDNNFNFVSAESGGVFDSTTRKILWNIPTIAENQKFQATFVLSVK